MQLILTVAIKNKNKKPRNLKKAPTAYLALLQVTFRMQNVVFWKQHEVTYFT